MYMRLPGLVLLPRARRRRSPVFIWRITYPKGSYVPTCRVCILGSTIMIWGSILHKVPTTLWDHEVGILQDAWLGHTKDLGFRVCYLRTAFASN